MASFASAVVRRFRELHFNRKYVRKHHSFVLCRYDRGVKLRRFMEQDPLVWEYIPTGRKPQCKAVLTRATLLVREIAKALAALIRLIHDLELTMNGSLDLDMLVWIPQTRTLKVCGLRSGGLSKITDNMSVKDYLSVVSVLDEIFASRGINVPIELMDWTYYLWTDPLYYRELIPKHMFLLDDEEKVGRYLVLFQKAQQVKDLNYRIYKKAMSFVCAGNCEGIPQWQLEVVQSDLLEQVKNFKDPNGKIKKFEATEEGLVIFGRHSCSHLLDGSVYFVYSEGDNHFKVKIKASEVFSHIESFTPGLFEQFQKGMFVIEEDLKAEKLPEI